MLSPWSSMPDDFTLEGYLERYGVVVERYPQRYAGLWRDATRGLGGGEAYPDTPFREVRLDLGCGKGAFTVGSALREPDVLFIGMDVDPVSVAFAARLAVEADLHNLLFVPGREGVLQRMFAPGELSTIYLNFPTPHPKGREAHLRLVHRSRLDVYAGLLAKGGLLRLQTDNHALFAYTLGQLDRAGWRVTAATEDARSEFPATPETGYERRAVAMGATICALDATPGEAPGTRDVTATPPAGTRNASAGARMGIPEPLSESLYDYLPADLGSLGYVPPEMARAVAAMRRTPRRADPPGSTGSPR